MFLVLAIASFVLAMFGAVLAAFLVNAGMGGRDAPHFGGRAFGEDLPGQMAVFNYLWRGRSPHPLMNMLLIANRVLAATAVATAVLCVVSAYVIAFTTPH